MVTAVVVRIVALAAGIRARICFTAGPKSQRFAITIRYGKRASGPTPSSSICREGPSRRASGGWRSRRPMAAARTPMAVSRGGVEE